MGYLGLALVSLVFRGWQTGGWSWASKGLLAPVPSSSVRLCLAAGAQAAGQAGAALESCRVTACTPTAAGRGKGQPMPQPASPPITEGPSLGSPTGRASPLSLGRGLVSRADVCLPRERREGSALLYGSPSPTAAFLGEGIGDSTG